MSKQQIGFMDDFGDPGEVNPLWGFVGGGAVTGTAMITAKALGRSYPRLAKHAGIIGGGIGLAASGIAMIFEDTRRAGYLGAVAALLTSLPEVVRSLVLVPRGLGDAYDMGYTAAEFADAPALEILGLDAPPPVQVLQDGIGYTAAEFAGTHLAGWAH